MENTINKKTNLEPIRVALQREFVERCQKNPSYSLRAFAAYLQIDQSFLSKLLKGQRRVTPDLANQVIPKLKVKPDFLKSLFKTSATSLPGFLTISDDDFDLLSDWKHFAMIELAKTKGFDSDEAAIAKRLSLHVEEVREATARLERMGYIEIKKGKWKLLSPKNSWSNTSATTQARRDYQRSLIEKSLNAIDNIDFENRENGSLTIAINKKRLPEFKEKLKQMRAELADYFQAPDENNLDEVYQLTVALFPLTKLNNK